MFLFACVVIVVKNVVNVIIHTYHSRFIPEGVAEVHAGLLFKSYLLLTLISLSGVGTTYFSSCCGKDSAIILTTGRLLDVNPS
jgi:hypothetical protein